MFFLMKSIDAIVQIICPRAMADEKLLRFRDEFFTRCGIGAE